METRPWHRHYDYNVPTTIRYPQDSRPDLLPACRGDLPGQAGHELLRHRAHLLAAPGADDSAWRTPWGQLGVKKGDRVGLHLPNCPQSVIAYLAAAFAGRRSWLT